MLSSSLLAFFAYMGTACVMLAVFMFVYEFCTPYHEIQEIKAGNTAAAIAFVGASIGFVIPLATAIVVTHSIPEMMKWATLTSVIQLITYTIVQRLFDIADCVRQRRSAGAILLAGISVAVGLLNAASIT